MQAKLALLSSEVERLNNKFQKNGESNEVILREWKEKC